MMTKAKAPVLALLISLLPVSAALAEGALLENRRIPVETIGFSLIGSADEGFFATPVEAQVEVIDEYSGLSLSDGKVTHEVREGSAGPVQVIHVSREGFSSLTLVGVKTPKVKVYLKPLAALTTSAIAKGKLTDYKPFIRGNVEGGLVLRSLGIADLLALNMDSLVSPLKDEIRVITGTQKVPSNLVFPTQKVSILIGSITLDKPTFRLPVSTSRRLRLVASEASIGVKDMLDQLGDLKPVNLVNLLQARKIGWTEKFAPIADVERDIALTHDLVPSLKVAFSNPPFTADIFALSVLDMESDVQTLVPTDVKAAKAGSYESRATKSITLSSVPTIPSGISQKVVVAAVSPEGDRISASLSAVTSATPTAEPFLEAPILTGEPGSVSLQAPQSGVAVLGWTAEDSGVAIASHQVAVLPSAGKIEIPAGEWSELRQVSTYSLAQIEFGHGFSESNLDGAEVLRNLTRFTYSRAK